MVAAGVASGKRAVSLVSQSYASYLFPAASLLASVCVYLVYRIRHAIFFSSFWFALVQI